MQKFINPLDPQNVQLKIWIIAQIRAQLGSEVQDVQLTEMTCQDSSCLHAETVLRVEFAESINYFKIPKPLVFIRKLDIIQSLQKRYIESPIHYH